MGSSLCGLDLMFKISFIRIQNENKSKVIFEDMPAPGLMCRIEADQHRYEHFRVPQAEVQLTSHKWSLCV